MLANTAPLRVPAYQPQSGGARQERELAWTTLPPLQRRQDFEAQAVGPRSLVLRRSLAPWGYMVCPEYHLVPCDLAW